MSDKGWRFLVKVHPHSFTFMFGCRLEVYRQVVGWPSISLWVHFWHRAYRFWFYKMGEDHPATKPKKPKWWQCVLCALIICGLEVLLWALDLYT